METLEAIKNRRSIRKYKTDPVDDKTLETILDAARLAPSWSNTQCTRLVVVRDNDIKARLADTIVPPPKMSSNPASNAIRVAPVVIVACAEKNLSGYFEGKASTDKGEFWFMLDVGLAMENLVLAAASLGLGTVHVGLFDSDKVAAVLNVPDNYYIVEMTPLGYPEFQPNPRPRKSLADIVTYDKFGQK
jgi:nitroreductase